MNKKLVTFVSKNKEKLILLGIIFLVISMIIIYAENKFDNGKKNEYVPLEAMAMSSDVVFEQQIKEPISRLVNAIDIKFGTFVRTNTGNLQVAFYEEERLIKQWTISTAELKDNEYYSFGFEGYIRLEREVNYRITLVDKYEGDNCIAFYFNPNEVGGFDIYDDNHSEMRGAIHYRLNCNNRLLKSIIYALVIVCAVIVFILVCANVSERVIMSGLFAILIVIYMFICPAGMAPDETNHYLRVYEIANKSIISQHLGESGIGGNYLPTGLWEYKDRTAILNKTELMEYQFGNTSLYFPLSYLPHVIMMKIFGFFSSRPWVLYYGGRIGNAIAALILGILTLCNAPFGRKIFFIIMTFPMALQEMVTLTSDGFTISMCLFFLAYILKMRFGNSKIRKRDIAVLAITGVTISLCKIVYVVVLLLLFMIPNSKFNSKKQAYSTKLSIFGISVLMNILWLRISSGYLVEFYSGINSSEQVKYVLGNVGNYYAIVIRSLFDKFLSWVSCMIGSDLGAFSVQTNPMVWIGLLISLIYASCSSYENDIEIRNTDCVLLMLSFLAGSALILTSLYVEWTVVGAPVIEGVQGRYFIPIIGLLMFFIVLARQKKLNDYGISIVIKSRTSFLYMLLLLFNSIAMIDLVVKYLVY